MISQRQLEANRQNAQKCTGPRTPEGKASSSRNALVHGLRAERHLLDGEDPTLFEALCGRLNAELAPDGTLETELVDRIANLMWRARRVPQFELALLNWMGTWCETFASQADSNSYKCPGYGELNNFHTRLKHNARELPVDTRNQLILGRLLQYSMDRDLVAKLSRYEAHLLQQLERALAQLKTLQMERGPSGGA